MILFHIARIVCACMSEREILRENEIERERARKTKREREREREREGEREEILAKQCV